MLVRHFSCVGILVAACTAMGGDQTIEYPAGNVWPVYPHWAHPKYPRHDTGPCSGAPLGALVHAPLSLQIRNGLADQLVLYQYDFTQGPPLVACLLNPHGQKRLGDLARLLPAFGIQPLVIETSGDQDLDEARRRRVLDALAEMNATVSPEMVVVGLPRATGVNGVESRSQFHRSFHP